jgi:glycosyltransferase involved in cell wall biosynthesis
MRILSIQTYLRSERINPRAGGKSRISLMLARYLLESGHEVALYPWPERIWGKTANFAVSPDASALVFPTLALPPVLQIVPNAFRLVTTRLYGNEHRSLFEDLCFLEGLKLAIARFQPDILHCHQTESDIPPLLRILGKSMPVILTHHSGRSGHHLDVYDRIIFLSRTMQEQVCRRSGFPVERSRVLYCPISDIFLRGEVVPARERAGIAYVGGLKDAKGVDVLLEAYRQNKWLRNQPLHLCGTGPDEERYKEYAARYDLPVVFHGRIPTEEIKTVACRVKLLVNPSRMEAFSVALLEALACGTPVVGWADQVNELAEEWHRTIGFGFDARIQGADELAALINRALNNPFTQTRSRRELSALARESFSMNRYGAEMNKQYAELLGQA